MSKNWTLKKIIGLGLNFTYEFEVCSITLQSKNITMAQEYTNGAMASLWLLCNVFYLKLRCERLKKDF